MQDTVLCLVKLVDIEEGICGHREIKSIAICYINTASEIPIEANKKIE